MTAPRPSYKADLVADGKGYSRYERIYLVLAATFVVLLVLTNIVGIKLFQAPLNRDFALTTGILTYPLTFLCTDLVSEIYGKKRADFMVILGFFMSMLMLVIVQLAVRVPPHDYWVPMANPFFATTGEYQHAFESVFALNGVLLVGSMLAYLSAQLTDNYLYHFWKRLTAGKHLWLRNNGSTMISQLVDTGVVNSILFYIGFGMDFWTGVQIMATIYIYKVCIAALDTPLIYLGVFIIKGLLSDKDKP
ncbi:MAG: queuosine precursor transporter [Proteobacteria bacterium]|jgi:queuosine precursor transporter|nr:queuosine precursor transporter [Pseudomonadota bacterium]